MVSLTLSRFTGPEMNESLTSKFYFCTSRKLASNVFFALCCLFFFVLFFSSTVTQRKETKKECLKLQRGKGEKKLHISNYTSSFIILGKRP